MDGTATYLYCIVHGSAPPATARAPKGLPGATPPAIAAVAGSLSLVIATVPLDVYGPEVLEASLRDAQWVTDCAVAHEAVVEYFARKAGVTVIPMKLFTMFSSEKRAIAETRSRRRDVEEVIGRIAGCEEWGVRITRRPAAGSRADGGQAKAASGTEFLSAKKAARDVARQSAGAGVEAAERAYSALAAVARDARRRQDVPEGATTPPLLDAAFLVPVKSRSGFKAIVKKLAAAAPDGTQFTLTGPWPSYNFIQSVSKP